MNWDLVGRRYAKLKGMIWRSVFSSPIQSRKMSILPTVVKNFAHEQLHVTSLRHPQVAAGAAAVAVAAKLSPATAAEEKSRRLNSKAASTTGLQMVLWQNPPRRVLQGEQGDRLVAVDLLNPNEFETVQKYGLVLFHGQQPNGGWMGGINKAWNRVEHHDKLVQAHEGQHQSHCGRRL